MVYRFGSDKQHLADQVANVVVRGQRGERSNGQLNNKTL
jgi:hypothetical protein